MAGSQRRLGRSPNRRKPPMQLDLAERDYLRRYDALGHSLHTIAHYQRSLTTFHRCLAEAAHPATTESLTTTVMTEFARWLRITPTRGFRGETTRREAGIHGILGDLRALTRLLHEAGSLAQLPKVPVNKLPDIFFPILTDAELDRVFATRQFSLTTERY